MTSLTTAFCIDFLNFEKSELKESEKKRTRLFVHIGFSLIIFFIILIVYKFFNDRAIINNVFTAAGYTYGPILGLFAFGILTSRKIADRYVIPIALAAPILTIIIDLNSEALLGGFKFGFMNLALNGFLTFLGLLMISKKK